eukprot:CAMPEP_0198241420 /NCGR_PEP_ID=MMETSP1446-20131203/6238_1 /TAXON_ID=1461542 ORGANISM="Unidentified sp, Strain CCMP2111" /NCGR_SAMPLE_ID=MMETSP1446 /ASSEMBLY_ACC=CAM_ASM_001112 /LENGTH=213 /DNA_ID=CAMNT_0043924263 /DNA_START=208 /DNA_END=846 /DNA_ORIENTATION=-
MSLDANQLDFEIESGSSWDHPTGTSFAISKAGRDKEPPLSSDLHWGDVIRSKDTDVPALDDHTGSDVEFERFTAIVTGIEFNTVGELPNVVALDFAPLDGFSSCSDDDVAVLKVVELVLRSIQVSSAFTPFAHSTLNAHTVKATVVSLLVSTAALSGLALGTMGLPCVAFLVTALVYLLATVLSTPFTCPDAPRPTTIFAVFPQPRALKPLLS